VTIADFALYGVVARMKAAQPALVEGFANVARWTDAMAARPAIQRAMKFERSNKGPSWIGSNTGVAVGAGASALAFSIVLFAQTGSRRRHEGEPRGGGRSTFTSTAIPTRSTAASTTSRSRASPRARACAASC